MRAAAIDACGADASLYAFRPNTNRARRVEAQVRAGLADSLAAALRALAGEGGPSGDDLVARVRAGPVAPVLFGAYTELVEAIFLDDIESAVKIAIELCAPEFGCAGDLRIVTLNDSGLGKGQTARFRRLVDGDPEVGTELGALPASEFASASDRVRQAVALLEEAVPELAGEFRALIRDVVLVETAEGAPFGASSFQLWGALFLKLQPNASRVAVSQSLAHESAHALLFGFSMGKPLVKNNPDDCYPSPLRRGPRPLDGVVHATYVIARMHYTAARLLESGLLTEEEERIALEARERHKSNYAEALPVIIDNVRWTAAGQAAFAAARAYMTAPNEGENRPHGQRNRMGGTAAE